MTPNRHSPWKVYLDLVVAGIGPGPQRDEVRREIESHLESLEAEALARGASAEQAAVSALATMGDPVALSRQLAALHRPRLNWTLIAATLGLLAVGLSTMGSLGRWRGEWPFALIGLFAGGAAVFWRRLSWLRFSQALFIGTVAAAGMALLFGPRFQGEPYLFFGPLRIKVMDTVPYLFVVALSGLLARARWEDPIDSARRLAWCLIPIAIGAAGHSFPCLVYYSAAAVVLLLNSGARGWQLGLTTLAFAVAQFATDLPRDFLAPGSWPVAHSAERHTDFVFYYLMSSAGRAVAALVLALSLLLTTEIFRLRRCLRDESMKLLASGLAVLFGGEIAWSVLTNLGWAPMPMAGLNLPFISYGGSLLIVHLVSIGLLVGAYRSRHSLTPVLH